MSTLNRMQAHWPAVYDFIKKEWPKLSEAALGRTNGDYDLFLRHLNEIYHPFPLEEAKARDKLQHFLNQLEGI